MFEDTTQPSSENLIHRAQYSSLEVCLVSLLDTIKQEDSKRSSVHLILVDVDGTLVVSNPPGSKFRGREAFLPAKGICNIHRLVEHEGVESVIPVTNTREGWVNNAVKSYRARQRGLQNLLGPLDFHMGMNRQDPHPHRWKSQQAFDLQERVIQLTQKYPTREISLHLLADKRISRELVSGLMSIYFGLRGQKPVSEERFLDFLVSKVPESHRKNLNLNLHMLTGNVAEDDPEILEMYNQGYFREA
jgi:hypothetical protein